jgi:hypothetical protein
MKMCQSLIAAGDVFVEVYGMKYDDDGSRLCEYDENPDYYDLWIRPHDWETTSHDTYEEWEYLSLEKTLALVDEIVEVNPGIEVHWVPA